MKCKPHNNSTQFAAARLGRRFAPPLVQAVSGRENSWLIYISFA